MGKTLFLCLFPSNSHTKHTDTHVYTYSKHKHITHTHTQHKHSTHTVHTCTQFPPTHPLCASEKSHARRGGKSARFILQCQRPHLLNQRVDVDDARQRHRFKLLCSKCTCVCMCVCVCVKKVLQTISKFKSVSCEIDRTGRLR